MKTLRHRALAATLLLHGGVLGALALAPWQPPPAAPREARVSVRLLDAPAPQARPQPRLQAAAPVHLVPRPALIAEPVFHITAAPAPAPQALPMPVAIAMPALARSSTPTPTVQTTPAEPAAPQYRAAMPADRQCAAQSVARHYPPLLRERGIEGLVLLRVRVDEQGRATDVQVRNGSGFRLLDEAAQRLTQACQFLPARRGEQALASWVEYPVRFALN